MVPAVVPAFVAVLVTGHVAGGTPRFQSQVPAVVPAVVPVLVTGHVAVFSTWHCSGSSSGSSHRFQQWFQQLQPWFQVEVDRSRGRRLQFQYLASRDRSRGRRLQWFQQLQQYSYLQGGSLDDQLHLTWLGPIQLESHEVYEVIWEYPKERHLSLADYSCVYGDWSTNGKGDRLVSGPQGEDLILLGAESLGEKGINY